MNDFRLNVETSEDGAVRYTVDVPASKRTVERLPIAGRADRLVELPVVVLPPELYPGDEAVPVSIFPTTIEVEEKDMVPPAPAPAILVPAAGKTFRDAAAQYRKLYPNKLSMAQESVWLDELMPFVGDLALKRIYDDTLQGFIESQRAKVLKGGRVGVKDKTLALKLGCVRHILRLASRSWRDEDGETWLAQAPLITMPQGGDERPPRQLTWQEQREHLHKLPEHLYRMALFDLQCGVRDDVVCSLRWAWRVVVPVDGGDIMAFVVPPEHVKGQRGKKSERVLVCNTIARRIVESVQGMHPEFVFVYTGRRGRSAPRPVQTINNSGWQSFREDCGLGDLHVHDLRHTVATRLREARVPMETISSILWHSNKVMSQHYAAGSVKEVYDALELITDERFANNKTLASIAAGARAA